jgi:SPP1 gp7 family putative phage head morphogenesis protein
MPSVNDKILDEIIGHSVDLHRLEASVKFRIRKELKKLEKGLVDELNNSNIWDAKRQQTRQKRLKALLKQTKETIESTYKAISKEHLNTLTGVASLAERQAISSINNSINFELTSVSMSKQMLKAIASDTLFEGAPSKEWWARRSVAFQAKFADTVRQGMMRGDDTKTITRNLVGTAKNKFKDGALAPNYRSAEALVRTSIQSVANTARIETYQDNKDLIKGIQWSSTFDSRTTETCATLDGEQWNMDFEPLNGGPVYPGSTAHWNCRSTTVAIIKSWEELGAKGKFKEIPKSTQASMDGQVSGKLTYEGWLKSKSKATQEDVLGVTKRKLWKEGKLGFSDLVSGSGSKPLTVEQILNKL